MVNNSLIDAKRIAKNTLLLYVRMALVMLTTLYTSRILLQVLGFEDYGIYNVVAGIVVMFSFLNSSMSVSVQRFLSYALGQNNHIEFRSYFSNAIYIHILIAFVIALLAEFVGRYFFNILVIPEQRINAAYWIFQFSIFSFVVSVCQTPFMAAILANERMGIYAYVGLFEVFCKLAIIYVLRMDLLYDRLQCYGILVFLITLLIAIIYISYCLICFSDCRSLQKINKKLFIKIFSFSSWNFMGAFSLVAVNQGINIILNLFFGPVVNAARGIAYQINSALTSFVYNIQSAINPQIIKLYAAGHSLEMLELTFRACKYCYFLLFLFSFPFLFYSQFILELWLGQVPQYASIFCKLILVSSLLDSLSGPIATAQQATGNIKYYQFWVSCTLISNVPLSYIGVHLTDNPKVVFIIYIIISFFALFLRYCILHKSISIRSNRLFMSILAKIAIVTLITLFLGAFINLSLDKFMKNEFVSFILFISLTLIINIVSLYYLGLDAMEKNCIKKKIHSFI